MVYPSSTAYTVYISISFMFFLLLFSYRKLRYANLRVLGPDGFFARGFRKKRPLSLVTGLQRLFEIGGRSSAKQYVGFALVKGFAAVVHAVIDSLRQEKTSG